MAAYEELPGLFGQKFQTEYFSRKNTQTSRSKIITKVSKAGIFVTVLQLAPHV
jgi:hypothetical protein